jgi:hypothetical protein
MEFQFRCNRNRYKNSTFASGELFLLFFQLEGTLPSGCQIPAYFHCLEVQRIQLVSLARVVGLLMLSWSSRGRCDL